MTDVEDKLLGVIPTLVTLKVVEKVMPKEKKSGKIQYDKISFK